MTNTRKAALAVADRARDADDCRDLLNAFGLLAELAPAPVKRRELKHGTPYAYTKGCCRCDICKDAHRKRCQESRARSADDPSRADRAGHGKASTYKNHGCRCAACSAANTADVKAYRARRRARLSEVTP